MSKQKTVVEMSYESFLITMKDLVKQNFGEEYTVELKHITKNNSIELDSLIILRKNERITPNIYLNVYYQSYMEGVSLDYIKTDIITTYKKAANDRSIEELYIQYEFEEMKSCIIYRLVNYNKNESLLNEVPHIRFLDLAITFHCLVKNTDDGIGTIRITNEHINNWKVELDTLTEYSKINTPIIFPPVIRTMNEIIMDMLKQEISSMGSMGRNFNTNHEITDYNVDDFSDEELELSAEKLLKAMLEENEGNHNNDMYVISNKKGINGASCLLYPEVIKVLAEELQSDLYILPSSIHEIILVRDNGQLDRAALKDMVAEVNNTQVPEEEILSESVYFYSRQRDAITMY